MTIVKCRENYLALTSDRVINIIKDEKENIVIRILLMQMLDNKSFTEKRRVTLNEVSEATGLSRPTLTRIANIHGYNTNTDTINALCKFFDCTPNELLEYHKDED